ncbi:ABC transporter substrate-binding protein [Cohnella mopanensis]|uniref:ABC transporter substrate-binding protein n=1 Tax=Cohnella mopanensis TaxID=2911966 RepID=UPI001EF9AED8
MARSKSALVFLLLCIMVLILSPWADAPTSTAPIAVVPDNIEPSTYVAPVLDLEISELTIEVAMEEREFEELVAQNEEFTLIHPDIHIELRRLDPEQAYSTYTQSSQLEEAADIMLVSNEWVIQFASSGYLLPADSAFAGKALAEQFDALTAPLKWNGILWGVPRDMDPFVLVWNQDLLNEWLGTNVAFPLTLEQWSALADKSAQSEDIVSWLAIDGTDPLALMAWLENASSQRSDGIWTADNDPWSGTLFEQALLLLERSRPNVQFIESTQEAARALNDRTALAAIMPYSEAATLVEQPRSAPEPKLVIDHHSWKLPFVWPRGSCFVISSNTKSEEAASAWISEMTKDQMQLRIMEEEGKLPVYRSLYDSDRKLSNLIPGRTGQGFPNQSPLYSGPEMSARLEYLRNLWTRFALGSLSLEEWKQEWSSNY